MSAPPTPILETQAARPRLRRTLRHYVDHLVGASTGTAMPPISPASQGEVVLSLLAKCLALGDTESHVRLLQHFATLLARSAPLQQLDQHLATALSRGDLSPTERVELASLRMRLLIQLGDRKNAAALLAATWPTVAEDPHLQAELFIRQGLLAVTFGDYAAGQQAYERGLALALEHGDAARASIIYNYLGNMLYALDRYEEALVHYEQALEVAQGLEDPLHCARAEGGLAMTLDELGRYEEAEEHFKAARSCAEQAGDLFSVLSVDLNLSYHAILQGRYGEAKIPASRALTLARRLGDLHREATAWHNLGRACLGAGEYEDAWVHLAQALEKRLWLGKPLFTQTTLDVISRLVQAVEADRTLAPEIRQRLLQECREALEAARTALPPAD